MSKELQYLEQTYRNRQTTSLLNSIFMSTLNAAARTLVSVAENPERWNAADHLRFMVMMTTWLTVWVLRVLMDHFPLPLASSFSSSNLLLGPETMTAPLGLPPLVLRSGSTALVPSSGSSSMDLILAGDGVDETSVRSLGRALSHVLALMNEIPATSRKYQFAMAMADRIMHENSRAGHVDLLYVNRTALTSSFARTSGRLYTSLRQIQTPDDPSAWPLRAVKMLPLGSYVASYVKGLTACVNTVMSLADITGNWLLQKRETGKAGSSGYAGGEGEADVAAEKLAQELLWVTDKMRLYGAVEEAVAQWSYASGLASLSLTASSRVQGIMVKISAILMGDLAREDIQVPGQVKSRLLLHWLPLFCHSRNGLAFPILTSFEKAEVERAVDQIISTLPAVDQEVILANWLQDFSASASEWPNLQSAYDRWCHITRQFLA